MTDRQARKLIYAVIEANKNRFNDDTLEALEMGRTALEQPTVDVLDKISDEIRQTVDEEIEQDEKWAIGLRYALKIIDKYK